MTSKFRSALQRKPHQASVACGAAIMDATGLRARYHTSLCGMVFSGIALGFEERQYSISSASFFRISHI